MSFEYKIGPRGGILRKSKLSGTWYRLSPQRASLGLLKHIRLGTSIGLVKNKKNKTYIYTKNGKQKTLKSQVVKKKTLSMKSQKADKPQKTVSMKSQKLNSQKADKPQKSVSIKSQKDESRKRLSAPQKKPMFPTQQRECKSWLNDGWKYMNIGDEKFHKMLGQCGSPLSWVEWTKEDQKEVRHKPLRNFEELQSFIKKIPPNFEGFTGFSWRSLKHFRMTLPKNYYDPFLGVRTLMLAAMLWVTRKVSVKTVCVDLPTEKLDELEWRTHTDYHHQHESVVEGLFNTYRFLQRLMTCKQKYVITKITLYHKQHNQAVLGHANVLIVDMEEKSAIRYQPHGDDDNKSPLKYDILNEHLFDMFNTVGIRYNGIESCRKNGLQTLQTSENDQNAKDAFNGTCSIWSIYFMHMRIIKPEIDSKRINNIITVGLRNEVGSLTEFILSYANVLIFIGLLLCKHITGSKLSLQKILDDGNWDKIVEQNFLKLFRYAMFA